MTISRVMTMDADLEVITIFILLETFIIISKFVSKIIHGVGEETALCKSTETINLRNIKLVVQ